MALDFPKTRGDWKFDLVGLLAIIGESIIDEIVQPLTASRTILLPRLLPAPHALIRPSRRAVLPSTPVTAVGIYSGTYLSSVPYFPSMIHQFDLVRPFEFQEVTIELTHNEEEALHGKHDKLTTVRTLAPLKVITICSSLWTAGILAWAIILHDGPAVVAIVLVSLASSFHSAASLWQSNVEIRYLRSGLPRGDLALRTREGAFIVVHCSDTVARLLYTGEARCTYVAGATAYRVLIYAGTLLLMVGIVVMSNCSWTMQVTLGASYLALNVVYMFCALTPEVSRRWHWDFRLIKVVRNSTVEATNYTQVLWHAIRATKSSSWIRSARFAPATRAWDAWLAEAEEQCENQYWDADAAKDRWMAMQFGHRERQKWRRRRRRRRRKLHRCLRGDRLYSRVVVFRLSSGLDVQKREEVNAEYLYIQKYYSPFHVSFKTIDNRSSNENGIFYNDTLLSSKLNNHIRSCPPG